LSVKVILFIISFLLWVGLTWSGNFYSLLVGLALALFVSLTISDMFAKKLVPGLKAAGWFLVYIPVFTWECLKANFDVAYRVIHPMTPLNPGIVKVKTKLKSELGLTVLANSITLTPGTLSVDVDKKNGYLYVHWIHVESQDLEEASRIVVGKFERILGRIFE